MHKFLLLFLLAYAEKEVIMGPPDSSGSGVQCTEDLVCTWCCFLEGGEYECSDDQTKCFTPGGEDRVKDVMQIIIGVAFIAGIVYGILMRVIEYFKNLRNQKKLAELQNIP